MDLRALHAFRIVAETGSITSAAARLGTVQSALSARINQFEAAVGEPLFERLPRGIRLTPAGSRLLPYAERIERLAVEAVSAARGRQPDLTGQLRLGVIEIAAASVLPETLGRFLAAHREIDLSLSTGLSRDLVASLEAGDIDAVIVAEGFDRSAFISRALGRLPLALFRPMDRTPETLEQAFAFGTGCVCRARLEGIIHRRRWNMRVVELGSIDAILGCVEAGIGVTLMPEMLGAGRAVAAESVGQLGLVLICRAEADAMAQALAASCRGRL